LRKQARPLLVDIKNNKKEDMESIEGKGGARAQIKL